MADFPSDPEALAAEIEIPLADWPGNCHGIAEAVLRRAPIPGMRLVRGHFHGHVHRESVYGRGGPQQHSWLELEDGRILDPTRWAMTRPKSPYIYIGENDHYDEAGLMLRAQNRPGMRAAAFLSGRDLSGPQHAVASALENVDADGIRALYEAGGLRAPDGDISGSDADRLLDRFSDPVEHFRTPEEFFGRVRDAGLGAMVPVDTMIRVLDPGQVTVDRGANRLFDAPPAPEMTDHQRLFKVFCRFLSIEHRDIDIERELEEIGYSLDELHDALNDMERFLKFEPEDPYIPRDTRSTIAVIAGDLLGQGFGAELEVERYAKSIGLDRDGLHLALDAFGEKAGYDLKWLMPDEAPRPAEPAEETEPAM